MTRTYVSSPRPQWGAAHGAVRVPGPEEDAMTCDSDIGSIIHKQPANNPYSSVPVLWKYDCSDNIKMFVLPELVRTEAPLPLNSTYNI